jgi:demethylmenaquinone methyltransferase/2-methoxy-6-polyprenyl-1,4-benzoquinol methylase
MTRADLERSLAHYRQLAPTYDRRTRLINRVRLRAIEALGLRRGDVVLDAGCGTGWCLPELARRTGPTGRVIGFDPSEEMLAIARERDAGDSAAPIELVRGEAASITLARPVDAILFSYTHDLMRSPCALENVLRQARPGARIVATSTKLYGRWLFPLNWYLRATHRGYITDFDGLAAPWSVLAGYLDAFEVLTSPFTQHYIARGHCAKKTK